MYTDNTNTQEAKAGRSVIQGHLQIHSEFEATLGSVRPCFKNNSNNNKEKKKRLLTFQGHILEIALFLLQMMGTPIHSVCQSQHSQALTHYIHLFFREWDHLC